MFWAPDPRPNLLSSCNLSTKVYPPGHHIALLEAELTERYGNLRCPMIGVDSRAALPNNIPVAVQTVSAVRHRRVFHPAQRVETEENRIAPIIVGIQYQESVVI